MSGSTGEVLGDRLAAVILDAMPDAAVLVNCDGVIVFANARVEHMLGWPVDRLVGESVERLVPASVAARHVTLREGYIRHPGLRPMGSGLELDAVARDGTPTPVEVSLSSLTLGDEQFVIAAIRDASEQRALRRAIAETTEELAVARSDAALGDERDRIARDLHDGVIQRLFGAGLHLEASIGRADVEQRVGGVIDEIDNVIKEIRTTIFSLHRPRGINLGLEHALRVAVEESGRLLGHRPHLSMSEELGAVPPELGVELLAVVRETLSNVVKHARAHETSVTVEVDESAVAVIVEDDGVGFQPTPVHDGSGLKNLQERADRWGGAATVTRRSPSGTVVHWHATFDRSEPN